MEGCWVQPRAACGNLAFLVVLFLFHLTSLLLEAGTGVVIVGDMDGQLWEDQEGVGLFSAMCQVATYPYRGSVMRGRGHSGSGIGGGEKQGSF